MKALRNPIIGIVLMAASVALAQDPSAAQDTTPLRDPFSPLGYRPKIAVKVVTQPPAPGQPPSSTNVIQEAAVKLEPAVAKWPSLILKGLIRTPAGKFVANIEGVGMIEAEQTITVKQGGFIYRWKVNEITEKGVSYTKLDFKAGR